MFNLRVIIILLFTPAILHAQRLQSVKGIVIDKESKTPLIGVSISVSDIQPSLGTVTDIKGNFRIDNIPVGKHTLTISYIGYQKRVISDLLFTSAKEVIVPVELEESAVKMQEIQVTDRREHINEMAIVSVKTFDVQETERYAGSRGDPARMASNFAGVQGGDDSRNDIIVRGNSPQGIVWRLEGVDIPNPNHFSIPGTTGGPVTILDNKTLANSDFYMGAFPAEYGNGIAGVFDVRLRNGNNDRYEYTGQFGFLGTEIAAEGPLSRKTGSSFLLTTRYSTIKIFEALNIKIGTNSVPAYQDATCKLNFPIGKKANLAFFAIGGISSVDIVLSKQTQSSSELYGESDRDQYFVSHTGIVGTSYSYTINPETFTKITVAATRSYTWAHHDYIFRAADYSVDSLKNILGYQYTTNAIVSHWYLNKKLSSNKTLKLGIINNFYHLDLIDSSRQYPITLQQWQYRQNFVGNTDLLQAYIQYKYRPSDNTTITAGVHAQYLTHNQSKALEPRLALRKSLTNGDVLTAGYGLHSQALPLYIYFQHLPTQPAPVMHNYNIDFIRSHHVVIGYEHALSKTLQMRWEAYYQYLFNVPVEIRPGSSYSALNQGTGYTRDFPDTLQNTGAGYNYGIELTLEKKFSKGYYFLFSASLFDSKAKGNDDVYRNTDYNSHYAINLLGGYESKIGRNSTFISGVKITYAGGHLYSPADTAASNKISDFVVVDSLRNTLQFKDYFRLDLKIGARFNSKRVTHEIGLDLVNILGTKNVLSITYSEGLAQLGQYPYYTQYQLGFLPIFYYRIDFTGKK